MSYPGSTNNLFLERNSTGEASPALNTLLTLTVTREQLKKSTGSMLLTRTNSCTADHFYRVLNWMRSLGTTNSVSNLQFQISQDWTVWQRKENPRNRNDSFPGVASILACRFFTIIVFSAVFPWDTSLLWPWYLLFSLFSFGSGPFHCHRQNWHVHSFSHPFQKMWLQSQSKTCISWEKCREEKKKKVQMMQINLTCLWIT